MTKQSILIWFSFLLTSCAKIGAPSGGPKDMEPPKVLSSTPDSLQTNVNTNQITLLFDEFIQLNEAKENIIINPSIEDADYTINGKELRIQLETPLRAKTTYTVKLLNAIKDNNEGNLLPDYSLTFSTNTYIDSLQFNFFCVDALSNEPLNCLILLDSSNNMDIDSSSIPYIYKTRSSKDGIAQITNIPQRTYKIISYYDENNNKLHDLNEPITIEQAPAVLLDSSRMTLSLSRPRIKPDQYKLLSLVCDSSKGHIAAVFNHPIDSSYELNVHVDPAQQPFSKRPLLSTRISESKDSLYIFTPQYEADSLFVSISIADHTFNRTTHNTIPDSSVLLLNAKLKKTMLTNYIEIQSNLPIVSTNSSVIQRDSNISIDSTKLIDPFLFNIYVSTESDSTGYVYLNDRVIRTILPYNNVYRDTILVTPHTNSISYSNYHFIPVLESPCPEPIYQLLGQNEKILQNIKNSKRLIFNNLKPNTYRIRCICDSNNNGKYDPIQLSPYSPGETVLHASETIEIKEGWSLENQYIIFR
jgi:hypothetical protein